MTNQLSKAIVRLFDEQRFYAELLLQMDRIISSTIPLAAVCIKNKIQLHINENNFCKLTNDEQIAVLKHECAHILYNHIERAREIDPTIYEKKNKDIVDSYICNQKHTLINIAADCSINPSIKNLPTYAVYPKNFNLRDHDTMEWYVKNLKDNNLAKEVTHFDDHSLWAESDEDKTILKEVLRQAINKAAANTRGAGKMTAEDELLVSKINSQTKNWKSELRQFVASALNVTLTYTKKKRNRRYGILYPGAIKEELLNIGIAIDTSGSITNEALCQFMSEITNISKYATITVVEADSEIKNAYLFDPKKTYTIKGRGGTAYQPAFDYFDKLDIDGMIYFGDMDCADTIDKKPKYPVLWAIVGEQEPPVKWGKKTKIVMG